MPPLLFLIRHAQSEWNAAGRWQGHGDPPLSALGREQARELAEQLEGQPIDRLYYSDLVRALKTAEPLGKVLHLTPTSDARLRELDVGSWTGLTREQIARRDPDQLERFEAEDPSVKPGGGESRAELRLRARTFLEEIVRRHARERVVLVTHLGFVRALLPGSEPANASLTTIDADEALAQRPIVHNGLGVQA